MSKLAYLYYDAGASLGYRVCEFWQSALLLVGHSGRPRAFFTPHNLVTEKRLDLRAGEIRSKLLRRWCNAILGGFDRDSALRWYVWWMTSCFIHKMYAINMRFPLAGNQVGCAHSHNDASAYFYLQPSTKKCQKGRKPVCSGRLNFVLHLNTQMIWVGEGVGGGGNFYICRKY